MGYAGKLAVLTICIALLYTGLFYAVYGNAVELTDRLFEFFAFAALLSAIALHYCWVKLRSLKQARAQKARDAK